MPDNYDEGESFAAGDDALPQFNNERLIELSRALEREVPDRLVRLVIWLAILRAIYGEATIL